jgi:hypothetical protein
MSRSPWKIRPTVARRMIQIVQSAGLVIDRVEATPDGRFVVIPRDGTSASTIEARPTDKKNEWDV